MALAGDSAIEFKSGQITSLAGHAQLGLDRKRRLHRGQHGAGVEQRSDGARFDRRGATFELENEASVSTTGALVNDGYVDLDANAGDGGSSLTVAGALTNSGALSIGNTTLSASDEVTAASLDNTGAIVSRPAPAPTRRSST